MFHISVFVSIGLVRLYVYMQVLLRTKSDVITVGFENILRLLITKRIAKSNNIISNPKKKNDRNNNSMLLTLCHNKCSLNVLINIFSTLFI